MARRTIDQKIALLQEQLAKTREKKRKDDARQKIIVGGAVIARSMSDPNFAKQLHGILNADITRPHDQELINPLLAALQLKMEQAKPEELPPPAPTDRKPLTFAHLRRPRPKDPE